MMHMDVDESLDPTATMSRHYIMPLHEERVNGLYHRGGAAGGPSTA